MAISVDGASKTSNPSETQPAKETSNRDMVEEKVRPAYEESKKELKDMDDTLAKAEQQDPGNKQIKEARSDLKDLDDAQDEVFKSTKGLAKAKDKGDAEDIEDAQSKSFDAQQNFSEKYQKLSGSLEALTGQPLPPLQQ